MQLREAVEANLIRSPAAGAACALAFLEAQVLGEEFRDVVGPTVSQFPPISAISVSGSVAPATPGLRRWLGPALAAGIALVAFSWGGPATG